MHPTPITSRQNPRVKDAVKLRDRRQRERRRRFLIDGARELCRAVTSGIRLVEVFICDELCTTPERQEAREVARSSASEIFPVTPEVFDKLAYGERGEGIVAVAETPSCELEHLRLPAGPLVAVLENVEKPGNLGAVLRSADGAGVSAVVVVGQGTDVYNPNAIRASLGTIFALPLAVANAEAAFRWLTGRKLQIIAARGESTTPYTAVDFCCPSAIVLGSEAQGLSDRWSGPAVAPVSLPMQGIADSLNVSVAAAVLFYEALRQRTDKAAGGSA